MDSFGGISGAYKMDNDPNCKDSFARIAFVVFVGGWVLWFLFFGAYIIYGMTVQETMPVLATRIFAGVCVVCQLVAVTLGIVGWRHTAGKVAVLGNLVLLSFCLVLPMVFFLSTP